MKALVRWRTLKLTDIEGCKFAETEGGKVADTIFNRAGKWPTPFLLGLESSHFFFSKNWNVADSLTVGKLPTLT